MEILSSFIVYYYGEYVAESTEEPVEEDTEEIIEDEPVVDDENNDLSEDVE